MGAVKERDSTFSRLSAEDGRHRGLLWQVGLSNTEDLAAVVDQLRIRVGRGQRETIGESPSGIELTRVINRVAAVRSNETRTLQCVQPSREPGSRNGRIRYRYYSQRGRHDRVQIFVDEEAVSLR